MKFRIFSFNSITYKIKILNANFSQTYQMLFRMLLHYD